MMLSICKIIIGITNRLFLINLNILIALIESKFDDEIARLVDLLE